METDFTLGLALALGGAALSTLLAGTGSAIGISIAARAGTGVVAEDPKKFGMALAMQAIVGSQGIYGLLIGFLILLKTNILSGVPVQMGTMQGLSLLIAAVPIAVVGLTSGIAQGKASAAGIALLGRNPSEAGKGIIMIVMVETYAVLALLMSFLIVNFTQIG